MKYLKGENYFIYFMKMITMMNNDDDDNLYPFRYEEHLKENHIFLVTMLKF